MNQKRKQFIFLSLFSLIAIQAFAQYEPSYKIRASYISEVFDITFKKPKGFVDLKSSEAWKPGERSSIGSLYGAIFKSKDGNCIIMYPSIITPPPSSPVRNQATGEIEAALGLPDYVEGHLRKTSTVDFEKYLTAHVGQDARQWFNADSVLIAQLPIKKAYKDKYAYCTGVYICKKDRPNLFFKFFFTETGKQHEQKYLKLLRKKIWYRNDNWVYDKEKEIKANHEILFKDRYKR